MKTDKVVISLSIFLIVFSLFVVFLGIINPSWIWGCQNGEIVTCYDKNSNEISGVDCICENQSDQQSSLRFVVLGFIGFILGFIGFIIGSVFFTWELRK